MKQFWQKRHNIAFFAALFITIYLIFNFFYYNRAELPENIPPGIMRYLTLNAGKKVPIFLGSQLYDRVVGRYPKLNIYPGGRWKERKKIESDLFYLLTPGDVPRFIEELTQYEKEVVKREGELILMKFERGGLDGES